MSEERNRHLKRPRSASLDVATEDARRPTRFKLSGYAFPWPSSGLSNWLFRLAGAGPSNGDNPGAGDGPDANASLHGDDVGPSATQPQTAGDDAKRSDHQKTEAQPGEQQQEEGTSAQADSDWLARWKDSPFPRKMLKAVAGVRERSTSAAADSESAFDKTRGIFVARSIKLVTGQSDPEVFKLGTYATVADANEHAMVYMEGTCHGKGRLRKGRSNWDLKTNGCLSIVINEPGAFKLAAYVMEGRVRSEPPQRTPQEARASTLKSGSKRQKGQPNKSIGKEVPLPPSVLRLSLGEIERRARVARTLLETHNVDPATLSEDQMTIFQSQSPEWQMNSVDLLAKYGAERLRIVLPTELESR